MFRALGIVPARYAATRFPGKLLKDLAGVPVVVRTVNAALRSKALSDVWLATDDERISAVIHEHCPDVHVVMTPTNCQSGSDRMVAAIRVSGMMAEGSEGAEEVDDNHSDDSDNHSDDSDHSRNFFPYDVVVNVQGDEPLLDSEHIDLVVQCLFNHPSVDIATLVVELDATTKQGAVDVADPNVVKCVVDQTYNALYFSRSIVPHHHHHAAAPACDVTEVEVEEVERRTTIRGTVDTSGRTKYLKHIGLYAYRPNSLLRFVNAPPSMLEMAESLEQLRAMELGMKIQVVEVASAEIGIDTEEQLERARNIFQG